MKLTELFTADESDRAVSPVIGVILMVAITVILAAVIGTFVLGLGDQVQQTSPNAQWDWEQSGNTAGSVSVSLTQTGGDTVTANTLSLTGSALDSPPYALDTGGNGDLADGDDFPDAEVSAGDSITIVNGNIASGVSDGDEIRLVWTAEGGGQSSTLTTYEVNIN